MQWAVGVTTVPQRRGTLLPLTLASLRAAGWDRPRLFVDGEAGGDSWESEFGLPVTARGTPALNVSGNWFVSLWELYWRSPGADRYLMVQDDVAFCRNVRRYMEAAPYPQGAYLNLYTHRFNRDAVYGKKVGWHEAACLPESTKLFRDERGRVQQGGKGALALCFDQDAAAALLSSPHLLRKPKGQDGWRLIDGAVVEAMNRAGLREHVHAPSLCQHRGHESEGNAGPGWHSTILTPQRDAPDAPAVLRPKARGPGALCYMGDGFDALSLLR